MEESMSEEKLKIYLKPTWIWCQKAKEFLLQKGLVPEEHDLGKDPLTKEEILKLVTNEDGQMRGPIIVQGDTVVVFGYNREKLEKLFP